MSLSEEPVKATDIIVFDDKSGASVIRYNIPLTGTHTGQRIVRLDLGLTASDFSGQQPQPSPDILALEWKKVPNSNSWQYDADKAFAFFLAQAANVGLDSNPQAFAEFRRRASETKTGDGRLHIPGPIPPAVIENGDISIEVSTAYDRIRLLFEDFAVGLQKGELVILTLGWGNIVVPSTQSAEVALGQSGTGNNNFFLVETYGISAFLGDYGLGRTIRTFSLLPDEETKISIKTWRSTTQKIAKASSVIDSFTDTAASRFTNTVQRETTDKFNRNNKLDWHAEAEVNARWGWGDAKVEGGVSGGYQESREHFAKQITDALQEHTREASWSRNNTVNSSSETSQETGEEAITERTIRNVNLRRVLNFVFRELNQEYLTKIHLLEIKVAYTNGTVNSWREVPISGLRDLLEKVLVDPKKIDEVASDILGAVGIVMDIEDKPVYPLDRLDIQPDGIYTTAPATPDPATHKFPAPPADRKFLYRFKPGPLDQPAGEKNKVDGVLLKEEKITMRTDSIVVEALLGQADALDTYATHSQLAEVNAKLLANQRLELGLKTLEEIKDPKERAIAYAAMFNPPPSAPVGK